MARFIHTYNLNVVRLLIENSLGATIRLVHPTKTVRVPSFTTDSGFDNKKIGGVVLGLDGTKSWIIRPKERALEISFERIRFV